MSRRTQEKLRKLRKWQREQTPSPKVEDEINAQVFAEPHREFTKDKFHKKGRVASFDMRNTIHGGSYAMARKGKGALLEHPYIRDERVRNRQLRFAGREINEHNTQQKIVVSLRDEAEHLYCLYRSADASVQIFLAVPTRDDPNFRIIEVTKMGVSRSLGYRDKERAVGKLTSGEIKWIV
jgi:hypothetical protein